MASQTVNRITIGIPGPAVDADEETIESIAKVALSRLDATLPGTVATELEKQFGLQVTANYFGYQPTPLRPSAPFENRRLLWRGDSVLVADNGAGLPIEKMHTTLVADRLNASENVIDATGGSTAVDVALRTMVPASREYQDARNPFSMRTGDVCIFDMGTNDAGSMGYNAYALNAYRNAVATVIAQSRSSKSLTNWAFSKAADWEQTFWAPTKDPVAAYGTGYLTYVKGAKASITVRVGACQGVHELLLANMFSSFGTTYSASIRRVDGTAAAQVFATGSTANMAAAFNTQAQAPYAPIPLIADARQYDMLTEGTDVIIEITNTGDGELFIVSAHGWDQAPEVRISNVLHLSDEAWKVLQPIEDLQYNNDKVDSEYRLALQQVIAFFDLPTVRAIRAELYDQLFSPLERGIRQPDLVHPNTIGQLRFSQIVYEGILGVPDEVDPDALSPVNQRQFQSTLEELTYEDSLMTTFGLGSPKAKNIKPYRLGASYTDITTGDLWNAQGGSSPDDWVRIGPTVVPPAIVNPPYVPPTPTTSLLTAIGRFRAGLRRRDTAACPIFGSGSSTTSGQAASSEANRYFNKLVAGVQAAYPQADKSVKATVVGSASADTALGAGVQGLNYGRSSSISTNFLTPDEVAKMIRQSSTAGVAMQLLMLGSNDWSRGTTIADFRTNVQAAVDAIKAGYVAAGKPVVIVLVGTYSRRLETAQVTPKAPWTDYLAVLREVAAADQNTVAYIDLASIYLAAGISTEVNADYDPFKFMDTDKVHQLDAGHDFMANELLRIMGFPNAAVAAVSGGTSTGGGTSPGTGTGTTPTWVVATSDEFTGAATTTIGNRSTDAKRGGLATSWVTPTPTAFGTDGSTSGLLVPGGTRATVETAGFNVNTLSQAMEMKGLGFGNGGSFWMDLRAESVSTSAVGSYRLRLTTTGTAVLSRRTANGGAGTGDLLTITVPNGVVASHVYRLEVYTNPAGNVVLRVLIDGAEVAGSPFIDDSTTKVTSGGSAKLTTVQQAVGYYVDYVTIYTA